MSKVNVVRRCFSCGAILQSGHPDQEGYIDKKILAEAPLEDILLCQSCYRDSKFNLTPVEAKVDPDFLTMLQDAQASDALIVYVVDLFSFECSFIKEVSALVSHLPMIVIANKRDLMPAEATDDGLKEYVAHRFRVAGVPLVHDDVFLMSLSSLSDTSTLAQAIEEKRRRHDVYIIGASGAGKSFFLSAYLRSYSNNSLRSIITATYPGTQLRVMQIPLDSSSSIYDTPGTGIENSLLGKGDALLQKALTPLEPLKARKYVLEKSQALFIGSLARIDLLECPAKRCEISTYFAKGVSLKKVISRHMDEEFKKSLEKKSLKPESDLVSSLLDMDVFDFPVSETNRRDIGIAGLGWISFEGKEQTIRLYVPKGIGVYGSRTKVK
jgi:ribosome biogenesis GTPase A